MGARKNIDDRLFEVLILPNGCWEWQGHVTREGYGVICIRRNGTKRTSGVHRYFYEELVGPIPDGLHLDHTCHNGDDSCEGGRQCQHRRCVNPDHLDPVEPVVNILRGNGNAAKNSQKTHCQKGHAFTSTNTYYEPSGGRVCVTCRTVNYRKYYYSDAGNEKIKANARERMREIRKDPAYKEYKNARERERYIRRQAEKGKTVKARPNTRLDYGALQKEIATNA